MQTLCIKQIMNGYKYDGTFSRGERWNVLFNEAKPS